MRTILVCLAIILFCSNARAQWVQTKGPESGEAFCLAASGKDLFVGTEDGVYRSSDDGASWTPTELRNTIVLSLAINFTGESDTSLFAGEAGGVVRSTDDGASWSQADFGLRRNRVRSLAVSDTDLFAGTDSGGVFLSPNNGEYWIPVSEGLTNLSVNSVAVIGKDIYAATDSGLFRSTNHGTSWTLLGLAGQGVNAVAAIDTIFFAGTDTNGVFRSTDNGINWTMISDPDMPRVITALAVMNSHLVAGTASGVYRTPNNGGYWIPVNTGLRNGYVKVLYVRGLDLFAGTYGGVFRSVDQGAHWEVATAGLKTTVIEALASRGESLYAGGRNGIYRSIDHGESWSHVVNVWAPSLAIDGIKIYAGTWGHVFYSFDDGVTWNYLWVGDSAGRVFALAILGTELLAGTESDGVLRIAIPTPGMGMVTTTDLKDTLVYALAVSGTDVFAGTEGGVFRSLNGGINWTAVNSGLTELEVTALAVQGSNLFAGTRAGGMFLSTNRGDSWTSMDSGLTGMDIQSFAINGNNLFAGTWQGGVFFSSNTGVSWSAVNDGLTDSPNQVSSVVHGLAIVGTDLYAGTRGAGVWRRPLSEMVVSVKNASTELPSTYSLQQNYPNPFNPLSIIKYTIGGTRGSGLGTRVKVAIYDMLGREVAVLVNERKQPGNYEVTFDASGLASGVYVYRMTAGNFVQSRKMLLLK